jgi:hypothetical protein
MVLYISANQLVATEPARSCRILRVSRRFISKIRHTNTGIGDAI